MTSAIDTIVVLDTETTGVDPATAALLEVAYVGLSRRGDVGSWEFEPSHGGWMIEHTGEIPPEARAVHHIGPERVSPDAGALPREYVIGEMLRAEVPGEMVYAAHNAPFDRGFLPELDLPWICTYRCARHIWPDAPGFSNQVLRYWLGVDVPEELLYEPGIVRCSDGEDREALVPLQAHRALYDTAVTAAILRRMLLERSVDELVRLTATPVLLKECRFGKHSGTPWDEVPKDYLRWMLREGVQADNEDLQHTVRHHLGLL